MATTTTKEPGSSFSHNETITVQASDEWSPLQSVLVGRASHSCFPSEPKHMIVATMPSAHQHRFLQAQAPNVSPFPPEIVESAEWELDNLARFLREDLRMCVVRPEVVDWRIAGGYTGAMPRDGVMVVGDVVIESCFAWRCRKDEVELGLGKLLEGLQGKVVRAPRNADPVEIYEGIDEALVPDCSWAINNTRSAFDAADFMRFGSTVIGQLSHVTNEKGVQWVRDHVPEGYRVELLEVTDKQRMHIDATILPLRHGLLIYNPLRVTEESLRKHGVFRDWELVAYPFVEAVEKRGKEEAAIPRFMTSAWLVINVLVLGKNRIVVEENDVDFAEWLEGRGMTVFKLPFRNVHAIGGSFHCATVDLCRTVE